eukprot:TRINITY_DN1224_c0_g1_i1.p1 TRINITY_DN1224_c0_g1~~TRINITY_DN1224_c0_g1_i1.p1  ORF type:complete len:565 (-),score=75.28 TRINITY_DN1224_c0_g1_i1:263-1957(-)
MCIRDRYQRRVRGSTQRLNGAILLQVLMKRTHTESESQADASQPKELQSDAAKVPRLEKPAEPALIYQPHLQASARIQTFAKCPPFGIHPTDAADRVDSSFKLCADLEQLLQARGFVGDEPLRLAVSKCRTKLSDLRVRLSTRVGLAQEPGPDSQEDPAHYLAVAMCDAVLVGCCKEEVESSSWDQGPSQRLVDIKCACFPGVKVSQLTPIQMSACFDYLMDHMRTQRWAKSSAEDYEEVVEYSETLQKRAAELLTAHVNTAHQQLEGPSDRLLQWATATLRIICTCPLHPHAAWARQHSSKVAQKKETKQGTEALVVQTLPETVPNDPIGALKKRNAVGSRFLCPFGLALSACGRILFVADSKNHCIRQVILETGQTALLAGRPGEPGFVDGMGPHARFNQPSGLAVSPDGSILFIADTGNNSIRYLVVGQGTQVSTLAGAADPGCVDGPGPVARFNQPCSIVLSPDSGNLFVADATALCIRWITVRSADVRTLSGTTRYDVGCAAGGPQDNFGFRLGLSVDGTSLVTENSVAVPGARGCKVSRLLICEKQGVGGFRVMNFQG